MKSNKKITLKNLIWAYLIVFSILILFFLWLFQIIFLNRYYENYKTKEIKQAAIILKSRYYKEKDLTTTFEDLLFRRGICIYISTNDSILAYNNNTNKSCAPLNLKNINLYEEKLRENDYKDLLLKSDNKEYERQSLVYAFQIEETTFFLTTTIDPIDSTVTILKNQFLTVSLVILILSFLIGWFISKKLSKPMVSLNESAKEIAKGNYSTNFDSNTNISEINELTTTLNYAKDELSKTDELRRELMANVSHDLKTPLTMIKAYAEMVRDISYKDKKKTEENLEIIIEEVDRLNLLVSDILDLSVMQANIYELKEEEFNIIEVIKNIINRYEIFTFTESYKFVFETSNEEIIIKADKQKIEQVLYNLINNAINYTGDNKKVFVKVIDQKDFYRIEITDTGKGIKDEDLNLIWDKYYKSSKKHKRNMIGTGLGLSIVKNIFKLHNYKYGVITKKNKGSTFYFEITKQH